MLFQVADLIGADPKEIIFTSGATESNNLAIKGISNFYRDRKKHIITTQTERECPYSITAYSLQMRGMLCIAGVMLLRGLGQLSALIRKSRTDHLHFPTADKCVLDSCRYMQQRGWDVTYLPVKSDGLVDLDQLRDAIRPDTAIVSVMYVNNEIGEAVTMAHSSP